MARRTVTDDHGIEQTTHWWVPDDPRALVVISHGASEHGGRYERFAEALNAAGIAAVAVDHRGHGGSGPDGTAATVGPGGAEALLDALDRLRADALAEVGDVPVVLFGHSLGSLIGLAYVTGRGDGLAGAVLCGFPADHTQVAAVGELLAGLAEAGMRDEPADLFGEYNAAFEPVRTPSDWLSRDPDEVDRYLADPRCGEDNPLTYGYLIDVFDIVAPAATALDAVACPVLVIAGDRDPAADMGAHPRRLAEGLADAGVAVSLTIYPDARHELLNETNRDEVTADVLAWIESIL